MIHPLESRLRLGKSFLLWFVLSVATALSFPSSAIAKSVTLIELFGFSFMEGARGTLNEGDNAVIVGADWVVWSYANDRVTWQVTADTEPALPGGWGVFSPLVQQPTCEDDGCNWIVFFPFVGREFVKGDTGSAYIDPALAVPEPGTFVLVLVGIAVAALGLRRSKLI